MYCISVRASRRFLSSVALPDVSPFQVEPILFIYLKITNHNFATKGLIIFTAYDILDSDKKKLPKKPTE